MASLDFPREAPYHAELATKRDCPTEKRDCTTEKRDCPTEKHDCTTEFSEITEARVER